MRRLALLLALSSVAAAAPAHAAPNDPRYGSQWGLHRIRSEQSWAGSRGGGTTIAVVDTGVFASHEDLAGKVTGGFDFVAWDNDPRDEHGHGTFVAGIAAAVTGNDRGIAGTAPDAVIMPVRVLDAKGRGSSSAVASGVRFAADSGARVINLSLGDEALPPLALLPGLDDAVSYAFARGALVVAAAGNQETAMCSSPAFSAFALCVGASDGGDGRAGFSNHGVRLDVVAPGVDIVSTYWSSSHPTRTDVYGSGAGTSFAAPFVSGIGAQLMARGATNVEAAAIIRCTARDVGLPGYDADTGFGVVNAAAAVHALAGGRCA